MSISEAGREPIVNIIPLGGLGEIGMNMTVFSCNNDAFIVDSGFLFPDESMPGVDLVIPDLDVLEQQGWNILGIILTHGHEDHIGALPYLIKRVSAPVYGTSLTIGLVEPKLEEFGLLRAASLNVVSPGEAIVLGPFEIDFIAMCHSVADAVGLAITTPLGLIIHSGDFKIDPDPIDGRPTDLEKIARLSRGGVLALLSDSTNVELAGPSGSEKSIGPVLQRMFSEAEGRIIVATFSSNIHRIRQVLSAAQESGRKVVVVGRSMATTTRIASERGYLEIPPGIMADIREVGDLPDNRLALLSTGSQGEPLSALSLMAYGRHRFLTVKPGDVLVLSSRFIPGNEKAINHIINEFCRMGARVEYEKVAHVHVSGHAGRDELRTLIRLVQPRWFVPIHGEYRHLRMHARLAVEEGVPEERVILAQDGDVIEFSREGAGIVDQLDLRRVYVDGIGIGDVGSEVLRDRRALSEVGLVTVVVVVARESGDLVGGPELSSLGVTYQELEPELIDGARAAVAAAIAKLEPRSVEEWGAVKDQVRLAVRRHINRILRRKPVVQTIVMWV
jgi:ribonuclease J